MEPELGTNETAARDELHDRIVDVLLLLSEVTNGEFGQLDATLPETHPLGALYRGINEAVKALSTTHEQASTYQRELEDKLDTIERQRSAIRELATPVIEVWDGVLCLPIVGVMDTGRSVEMTETLLRAVSDGKARCVIVDVTGISVMDTRTVDHLIRAAKAVRLLGAQCFLTGLSPLIAQTVGSMGIDLSTIATRRSLEVALQEYVGSRQEALAARTAKELLDRDDLGTG